MQTVYVGNTLINDVMLGSQRMDDVLQRPAELFIDWLLVGAGGSGGTGDGSKQGGGGGAGRFVSSSLTIQSGTSITIDSIGAGGAAQTNGNSDGNAGGQSLLTILGTTYTAPGGGYGGQRGFGTGTIGNGGPGGSGGGGGATGTSGGIVTAGGSNVVGTPIAGFGNDGEGKSSNSGNTPGGNGGGAGGTPTGYYWLDGNIYCVGGFGSGGSYGIGGAGSTYAGGAPSVAGTQGVVKIRYAGTPVASGGTITQSGGYTYHTFTTTGTFAY